MYIYVELEMHQLLSENVKSFCFRKQITNNRLSFSNSDHILKSYHINTVNSIPLLTHESVCFFYLSKHLHDILYTHTEVILEWTFFRPDKVTVG